MHARSRPSWLALALLIAIATAVSAEDGPRALNHPCPAAGEAARDGDWPTAVGALTDCLGAAESETATATLTALRAAAHRRAGDAGAAMKDYATLAAIDVERAVAAAPRAERADLAALLVTAPRHAGDIQQERGNRREALEHYLTFLELAPEHATLLPGDAARVSGLMVTTALRAATLAVELDQPELCLRTLQSSGLGPPEPRDAADVLPDRRAYLALLSRCYLEAERIDDGIAALNERADENDATADAPLLLFRGMLHREAGATADARRDLRAAADLAPDDPAPLVELGILHLRAGEHDRAMARARAALALAPEFPPATALLRHLQSTEAPDSE